MREVDNMRKLLEIWYRNKLKRESKSISKTILRMQRKADKHIEDGNKSAQKLYALGIEQARLHQDRVDRALCGDVFKV